MKKEKNGKATTVVLEVVRVKASSGHKGGGADTDAICFLQESGFQLIKTNGIDKMHMCAEPPSDISPMLCEYDRNAGPSFLFRLVRGQGTERTILESGRTMYVQEVPNRDGLIELCGTGDGLNDWTITCKEVGAQVDTSVDAFESPSLPVPAPPPQLRDSAGTPAPLPVPAPPIPPPEAVAAPPASEVQTELLPSCPFGYVMRVRVAEIVAFLPQQNDPKFSGQPRKWFDDPELKKLARSLKVQQREVITVQPLVGMPGKNWKLVNGERRLRAAQLEGIEYLWAIVKPPVSKKEQHLSALILNSCRVWHTNLEFSNALQEQIDAGETPANLAVLTGYSRRDIDLFLSLQKLHPNLRALLDPPTPKEDMISVNQGGRIARIAQDKQEEIWTEAKLQPTKELIMRKLDELGKPFFVHKRRRDNRLNDAGVITKRIKRQLNALDCIILELQAATPDELGKYGRYKGSEQLKADIERLNKADTAVQEIKQRLFRARASLSAESP